MTRLKNSNLEENEENQPRGKTTFKRGEKKKEEEEEGLIFQNSESENLRRAMVMYNNQFKFIVIT